MKLRDKKLELISSFSSLESIEISNLFKLGTELGLSEKHILSVADRLERYSEALRYLRQVKGYKQY